MDVSKPPQSFRGLLLRHRARTGLTQREVAAQSGVSLRSVQDWESGVKLPGPERLQALIRALLEAGGLTTGRETSDARELWTAARREATRLRIPFDEEWFADLLAAHALANSRPAGTASHTGQSANPGAGERVQDWGEAPDIMGFIGRAEELALLRRWLVEERCRLLVLLGMGGIGKTSLAARLAREVAPSFERVYWRSMRNAPPVNDWLAGALGFLSDQRLVAPPTESERITALLQLLRGRRCLVVLDNSETLFDSGQREGRYRAGMEGYGQLLQAVGETSHLSCLMLTSREVPPELAVLGQGLRTFHLSGFGVSEAQLLLSRKQLSGTSWEWGELNTRLGGNGLALKLVGETIREVLGGDIGAFMAGATQGLAFGGIRRLLAEQVERSSALEQQVLRLLAVAREPLTIGGLRAEFGSSVGSGVILEAVEGLRRRSLIERSDAPGAPGFVLQSVVLEYVTDSLVEAVADEIERDQPVLLVEQPLIKAQAKDYVRQTQERLIGAPILQRLQAHRGVARTESLLLVLLDGWRGQAAPVQGYGPGNVVNLLRLLRGDLRGMDLSRLTLRQVYLQGVDAQDASMANTRLDEAVLDEAFAFPTAIALSADGAWLTVGTPIGEVLVWRVADRTPHFAVHAHKGAVRGLAFSEDGQLLASASVDGTAKLWALTGVAEGDGKLGTERDPSSSQPLMILLGHIGAISGVALSGDGRLIASAGDDATVRLWDGASGRSFATLRGHAGAVLCVACSEDGRLVASGGEDGTVRLWEAGSGQLLATLEGRTGAVRDVSLSGDGRLAASTSQDETVRLWGGQIAELVGVLHGHTGVVRGVALSADGRLAASGSVDGTVRLWETGSGQPLATLQGHTGAVARVALSRDGHVVASASDGGIVRLWEAASRQLVASLQGHTGGVRCVALSEDGCLVASGSLDGTVRLWDTGSGHMLATLRGHTGGVRCVALSGNGCLVASGSLDRTVRLWDSGTGQPLSTLQGHTGAAGVALSRDGRLVAGACLDGTVKLWDAARGQVVLTLAGHSGIVRAVALSLDGRLVASGGDDQTVRLWDAGSGQLVAILEGQTALVRCVALSGDGRTVAGGSVDGTVCLWDVGSTQLQAKLQGDAGAVYSVGLSQDGELVASSAVDGTVRLWAANGGQLLATLQGHAGPVWGVALSGDGRLAATGGDDATVRLWDTQSRACVRLLQSDRRYQRLDITGLTGVTEAQRAALLALGAVQSAPRSIAS